MVTPQLNSRVGSVSLQTLLFRTRLLPFSSDSTSPGRTSDAQTRVPSGPPLVLLSRGESYALIVALLLVQAEVTGRDGQHGPRVGAPPI